MRQVRTGLVGCGRVGHIHAEALRTLSQSQLVAACDSSRERAEAFAGQYATRPFDDITEMLRESGLEALVVATPHPQHAGPTCLAAEAGVHVLVEKPMAATLTDCDAMLAAARKTGIKLGVISQRRLYEPVRRMKAAIDAGKLGRPMLGTFQMLSWRDEAYYRSDAWRGRWETEGGGVLVNQSPHMLDILQWLMGEIDEISGYWANLNHKYIEVEDTAVATIRFKGGGLGTIVTSLSQKPGIYTKIHIHGSSGASVGVQTDTGATFVAGMSGVAEPPFNDVWTIPGEEHLLSDFQTEDRAHFQQVDATSHYHRLQIQDFLTAVLEDRPSQVLGDEGRVVVEMITAIYRSNQERRPVRFPVIADFVPS